MTHSLKPFFPWAYFGYLELFTRENRTRYLAGDQPHYPLALLIEYQLAASQQCR